MFNEIKLKAQVKKYQTLYLETSKELAQVKIVLALLEKKLEEIENKEVL